MTVLSALAYAGVVICAAFACGFFSRAARIRWGDPRDTVSAAVVLAAFFFLPPGSLSPFCNVPWGGAAFLGLLACSLLLGGRRDEALPLLAISLTAGIFAWYVYQRGVPGSFANLGTFVAMPVWRIASFPDMAGFAFLAAGFTFAARRFAPGQGEDGSWPERMRYLAVCSLFVVFFLPWNTAPSAQWSDGVAAGCDMVLFWLKTLAVCFAFRLLRPSPHAGAVSFACCGVGALILAVAAG